MNKPTRRKLYYDTYQLGDRYVCEVTNGAEQVLFSGEYEDKAEAAKAAQDFMLRELKGEEKASPGEKVEET